MQSERTATIEEASERFYGALRALLNGDPTGVFALYEHSDEASAFHPAGEPALGWPAIEGSFGAFSQAVSDAEIVPTVLQVVTGEDLGYTIGLERVRATMGGQTVSFEHRATNIYRKQGGEWKMVHHHVDLDPTVEEIVARLMGGA